MNNSSIGRARAVLVPVAIVGVVLACSAVVYVVQANGGEGTSVGCGPVETSIRESSEFTSVAQRRGTLPPAPLILPGSKSADVPDAVSVTSINGLTRQWATVGADGAAYQYYAGSALAPDTSRADFERMGGIELEASPRESKESFAAILQQQFGDRVTPVQIGDSDGALVWADPESSDDLRMHHVYWAQNQQTFGLILFASPEDAVTTARTIACRNP